METPVHSKKEIYERLDAHHADIYALGVARIGLFGSFVRDEQTESSDVDVLVDFRPGEKTWKHFMGLHDLLQQILNRRIEIVTPQSLSPYIGPRILQTVEYVDITP